MNSLLLDLSAIDIVLLILILAISGFIFGVIGFGYGLFGVFALWIMDAQKVIPTLLIMSICNQFLSLAKLRKNQIPIREWWPYGPASFIVGGILGVPIGLYLLIHLNPFAFDELIGFMLFFYSLWMIFKKKLSTWPANNLKLNIFIGFIGGIVGGLIAVPGLMVVVWAMHAGISKEGQRAIVQPFVLTMQIITVAEYALSGKGISNDLLLLNLMLMPIVLASTLLGVWVFQRIQENIFRKLVLILLFLSGVSLIFKGSQIFL